MTCILCKLLEHIIFKFIHEHLDTYDILTESQHGFQKSRSCETQLIHTFNDFARNKENGFITNVITLNFDSVNHRNLLFKLERLGRTLILWIEKIVLNCRQKIVVEGEKFELCEVLSRGASGLSLG